MNAGVCCPDSSLIKHKHSYSSDALCSFTAVREGKHWWTFWFLLVLWLGLDLTVTTSSSTSLMNGAGHGQQTWMTDQRQTVEEVKTTTTNGGRWTHILTIWGVQAGLRPPHSLTLQDVDVSRSVSVLWGGGSVSDIHQRQLPPRDDLFLLWLSVAHITHLYTGEKWSWGGLFREGGCLNSPSLSALSLR